MWSLSVVACAPPEPPPGLLTLEAPGPGTVDGAEREVAEPLEAALRTVPGVRRIRVRVDADHVRAEASIAGDLTDAALAARAALSPALSDVSLGWSGSGTTETWLSYDGAAAWDAARPGLERTPGVVGWEACGVDRDRVELVAAPGDLGPALAAFRAAAGADPQRSLSASDLLAAAPALARRTGVDRDPCRAWVDGRPSVVVRVRHTTPLAGHPPATHEGAVEPGAGGALPGWVVQWPDGAVLVSGGAAPLFGAADTVVRVRGAPAAVDAAVSGLVAAGGRARWPARDVAELSIDRQRAAEAGITPAQVAEAVAARAGVRVADGVVVVTDAPLGALEVVGRLGPVALSAVVREDRSREAPRLRVDGQRAAEVLFHGPPGEVEAALPAPGPAVDREVEALAPGR